MILLQFNAISLIVIINRGCNDPMEDNLLTKVMAQSSKLLATRTCLQRNVRARVYLPEMCKIIKYSPPFTFFL